MIIASATKIESVTNFSVYGDAAIVNAAAVEATDSKLPCYAINGKRGGFRWVSMGSSCVIARGEAAKWLARFGADIDEVEGVS